MRNPRFYPSIYFGRPGALSEFPFPRGGVTPVYDRQLFDFVTGAGQHRVSKLLGGSRAWELKWAALGPDSFAEIEAYDRGHNGLGPWAFIDPSRINLLTANQSSATGARRDTRGFSVATANMGSLSSVGTVWHRATKQRSLRWQFNVNPINTTPVLTLASTYGVWPGIPVVRVPHTLSAWVYRSGGATGTVAAKIDWLDAAGSVLGSAGADVALSSGVWTRLITTSTPPVGTVYGAPRLVAIGSTWTVGESLYVDELQFEQDNQATDWVPGTGVHPVETLGFSEEVPFDATWRTSPTLVVREVVG